jgi:hypothetical protein
VLNQAATALGTAVASSLTLSHPFPTASTNPIVASAQAVDWDLPYEPEYRHVYALERSLLDLHATAEWLHPCLLQVRTLDSDSPTFWDIRLMSAKEQQLWETAMNQELANLVQRDTFSLVPRSSVTKDAQIVPSSVPEDAQIVPCQWALKKKWRPDLTLIKYKACLCLSGNRQQLKRHLRSRGRLVQHSPTIFPGGHAWLCTIQVWEDNRAAQILASSNPTQFTPRSGYYSTKMWWFKEHMVTDRCTVTISSIASEDNIADIMTKPLPRPAFECLRKRISGW